MTTKTIHLNTIAKSLKMDPKSARSKLRRSKNVPKTESKTRWEFKAGDVARVKKLLAA